MKNGTIKLNQIGVAKLVSGRNQYFSHTQNASNEFIPQAYQKCHLDIARSNTYDKPHVSIIKSYGSKTLILDFGIT